MIIDMDEFCDSPIPECVECLALETTLENASGFCEELAMELQKGEDLEKAWWLLEELCHQLGSKFPEDDFPHYVKKI